jgi:hypothetical protein
VQLKLGLNCLVELAPGSYLKSLLHLDIRASQLSSLPPVRLAAACNAGCDRYPLRLHLSSFAAYLSVWVVVPWWATPFQSLQYLTQATQLKFLGLSCCHDLVLDR